MSGHSALSAVIIVSVIAAAATVEIPGQTLWAIGFAGGTASETGAAGFGPPALLTDAAPPCSSLTEFNFMGVTSKCAFGMLATGCIPAFSFGSSSSNMTKIRFMTAQPRAGGIPCTVFTGGTNTTGNGAVKLTQNGLN